MTIRRGMSRLWVVLPTLASERRATMKKQLAETLVDFCAGSRHARR
jgi:hypothetical protein